MEMRKQAALIMFSGSWTIIMSGIDLNVIGMVMS